MELFQTALFQGAATQQTGSPRPNRPTGGGSGWKRAKKNPILLGILPPLFGGLLLSATLFLWPTLVEASRKGSRKRCRAGWHRAPRGYCVRDTCRFGWVRGRDLRCRRRTRCPGGFRKKGRRCVPRKCPRRYKRDSKGRCVPYKSLRCGAGAFRNPAGICVLVPHVKPVTSLATAQKGIKRKKNQKKVRSRRKKSKTRKGRSRRRKRSRSRKRNRGRKK